MPFDPNKPFEIVKDQEAKKAFDPNKPFQIIQKEVTENNEASKTQSNLDGDAQRATNQQGQAGSGEGTFPSQESPNGNRQVSVGQINPSDAPTQESDVPLTTNTSEESTKTESERTQWQEGRQTIRPEGTQGDKTQVAGGEVPSLASKAIGAVVSPIAYLGQDLYKGIAGISRQLGAKGLAEWATQNAETSVEDMAQVFGGHAPTSKAGQVAGQAVGTLLAIPATLAAALPGMVGALALGYGGMREDFRKKYMDQGLTEKDADTKATIHAGINTAVALPLYMLGGKVAGKAADMILAKNAKEITQIATRFGLNTLANSTASAITRGISAGLEGESASDAMKDFSISGFLQDMAFAGHHTGEYVKEQAKLGKLKEVLTKLSDTELNAFASVAKNENHKQIAQEEIERRKSSTEEKAKLDAVGLPKTAEVATATLPIKDPDPRVHNFLSLADDFISQGDRYSANRALEKATEAITGGKEGSAELQEQRRQKIQELNDKLDNMPPEAEKPATEPAPVEEKTQSQREIESILGVQETPTKPAEQAAKDLNAAKAAESKKAKDAKDAEAKAKADKDQQARDALKGLTLSESIERGHIFDYQGNQYKLLSLAEDGIVARDLKTKQEVLLPKGEMEGSPEGIDGMKLVKLGQPKKGAKSLSEVLKAKEAPEKITNIQRLETWANETVDRIKSEGRLNVGIDPEFIAAQSVKAAFEIARGAKSFAKWSAKMVNEFGKEIKPHLTKIWHEAKRIHDNPDLAEKYNISKKDEAEKVKFIGDNISIKLTNLESKEAIHRLETVRDEPDLLEDYKVNENQIQDLIDSIPKEGGEFIFPQEFSGMISEELQTHADLLNDMASQDANDYLLENKKSAQSQRASLRKVAKSFEAIVKFISTGGGRFLERGAERGAVDIGGDERFKPKPPVEPFTTEPTQPSKTKVQETSGVSTEQGKPTVETPAVKAEEGTPQWEGEGQEKIASAAYRDPKTGDIYTGEDHQDAALGAGFEAPKNPADRETPEYGYMTTSGRFVSREEGEQISKAAGQFKGKKTDRKLMHSIETEMTDHPEAPKSIPADMFSKNPRGAMAANIAFGIDKYVENPADRKNIREALAGKADLTSKGEKELKALLKILDLTTDDLTVLGLKAKGLEKVKNINTAFQKGVQTLADVVDVRRIGNLTRAGVKLQAYQHASARTRVGVEIEKLLSQVFPNSYKSKETMEKTMDIIVKDNILGGYETAKDELGNIKKELDQAKTDKAEGKKPKSIDGTISELSAKYNRQVNFIKNIEKSHNIEQYEKDVNAAKGTEVEKNIERWKQFVNPVMDELYLKMKDDETAPLEQRGKVFGARVNLLAKSEVDRIRDVMNPDAKMPTIKVSNYRNPDVKLDRLMNRAKFNEQYATDAHDILLNSLASRLNETTKIDLYKALVDNGAAIILEPGEDPEVRELNGETLVRMPIKMPATDSFTGRTRMAERNLWVQKNLVSELKQVLDTNDRLDAHPIAKAITKLQLLSFADATSHLKNLHAILTGTLVGESSALKEVMKKIPVANSIRTIGEIHSVIKELNESSPEIRAELADLAKNGLLRPHYESGEESPDTIVGKTAKFISAPFSSVTDMVHQVDTATRVIMNRRYNNLIKNWKADPSMEARIDFVNQVGEYNRRLMGRYEAMAKDYGASPFIVAGRAMNRFSRKLILADPGFKTKEGSGAKAAFAVRAAQASGLVFTGVMAMTLNAIFNKGNMFGRTGTPIGAVDFGPQFDTDDGKRRTFDLMQLVNLRRGLRQLGINSAIEGWRQGKSASDIQRDFGNDVLTTSMHPFIGPAAGLAFETATGKRVDLRQGYASNFDARKIDGFGGLVENLRVGLRQQNEFLYNLGLGYGIERAMQAAGIPRPSEEVGRNKLYGKEFPQNIPFLSSVGNVVYGNANNVLSTMGGKLQVSPALKLSSQYGTKQQYDPIQDLRYEARSKILDKLKKKDLDGAREVFDNAYKDGILTKADLKTLKTKITQPDLLVQRVGMLKEAKDAVRVFRVATQEEQDKIFETVFKKVNNSSTLTNPMKKALFDEMKAHAQEGTILYNMTHK